jgi:hypothetical protein
MKYMTPELIARFRSADDAVAEPAGEEWERRGEEYRRYLSRIEQHLPEAVRRLLDDYSLHDAKVLTMAGDERSYFSLFLEPETSRNPQDKYLELRYKITEPVRGLVHGELAGDGKPLAWWLYDEVELVDRNAPVCTHSVLLSGGCELQISFSSIECLQLSFFANPESAGEGSEKIVQRFLRLCA